MRDSLLLTAAALLAFGLSLGGVFHFDDYELFNNPAITSLSATRPLTNLTFRINEFIGGTQPFGYHLVNLLLHITAVLLLNNGLRRVIPASAALTAALIFAVHPVQTEAVNYVFARGTLLAAVFCAASLRSWLSGRHWWAAAWFAAALVSKEEAVAFPLFLLALHFSISRNARELRPIGVMLLLSLAAGLRVLAASANVSYSAAGAHAHHSPSDYLSYQGLAVLRYLGHLFIPWGFSIDPAVPQVDVWFRWLAWLLVVALAIAALRRFARAQFGLWIIGGLVLLLPSSSIFPADDLIADRRLYLPMLAFSAAAALLLARLDRRFLAALMLVWIAISARYCYVWNSEERLWTQAAREAPAKARPLIQLARQAASPAASLALLAEAQNKAPNEPAVASEQGRMYLALGNPAQALTAFGRALALAPNDPAALNNRGAALLALGQTAAARHDFEQALAGNRCLFDARMNLKRLGLSLPANDGCQYTPSQQMELKETK